MKKIIINSKLKFIFILVVFFILPTYAFIKDNKLSHLTKDLLIIQSNKNHSDESVLKQKALDRLHELLLIVDKLPEKVLQVSFNNAITQKMPLSIQPFLEKMVYQVNGVIDVMCALHQDHSETVYGLTMQDGKHYKLHFTDKKKINFVSGTKITIPYALLLPGLKGQDHLIVAKIKPYQKTIVSSLTPPYPTTGTFKTLAISVNFQDNNTQPWSTDYFNQVMSQVSQYDYEASYQQTNLTTDVVGWYTLPLNSTAQCDPISILTNAEKLASAAGINPNSYDRIVIAFPTISTCSWTSLGYIGGGKNWGISWINGMPTLDAVIHEMGHNFGLYDANKLDCTTPPSTQCVVNPNKDFFDAMGSLNHKHYNASEKEKLGWLNSSGTPTAQLIQTNGTYTIEPYESYSTGIKALKIPKSTPINDDSNYYYIENRQNIGFDSGCLLVGNCTYGGILHTDVGGYKGTGSALLDGLLSIGQTFTDPNTPFGGVSITALSLSNNISVNVSFTNAPSTCVRNNPTLSIAPNTTQWVNVSGSAAYVLTLTNNDSIGCSSSSFGISASSVANITSTLSQSSVQLSPGNSATINLGLQTSSSISLGTYAVNVTATNNSSTTNTATTTASLGVQSGCVRSYPITSFAQSSQSTTPGGTLNYTFNITNYDSSTCGASTFNVSTNAPSGLTAKPSAASVIIQPNTTNTVTIQVNSSASQTVGSYNFSGTATNAANNFSSTTVATYIVQNSCSRQNPTVSFSPQIQTSTPGGTLNYTFNVTNNDSSICGPSTFNFTNQAPNGFTISFNQNNTSISPGSTIPITAQVTSSSNQAVGNYTFTGTATNASATSFTATNSGVYVVQSSPGTAYSYNVIVGYPFTFKVIINGNITCPDAMGNPVCLITNQTSGSSMTITGSNNHKCLLNIQSDGTLKLDDANSNGCGAGLTPATTSQPGTVALPSQF